MFIFGLAVKKLRRPEPTKQRIELTTLGTTAIDFSHSTSSLNYCRYDYEFKISLSEVSMESRILAIFSDQNWIWIIIFEKKLDQDIF